jgi:hypothetical protein
MLEKHKVKIALAALSMSAAGYALFNGRIEAAAAAAFCGGLMLLSVWRGTAR